MRALYLSHPQVQINAHVPVPLWGLSELGRARGEALAHRGVVPLHATIYSSKERKAVEFAQILAQPAGALVLRDHRMGENDRSATGFLPPKLFEQTAKRFFAEPETSVLGWERAVDAQARIVGAIEVALAGVPEGRPAVFCGHGAVGTLLKCHVARRPISRVEDQGRFGDGGGGNGFVFDFGAGMLLSDWTPIELLLPGWFS